jgi:hypothetical protein
MVFNNKKEKKSNIEQGIMFHVPLCHIKINNWKEKKKLLLELYSKIEKNVNYLECDFGKPALTTVKNDYAYQSLNNKQRMYSSTVKKILEDEIIHFKNAYNVNEIEILESWFERGNMGDYHPIQEIHDYE